MYSYGQILLLLFFIKNTFAQIYQYRIDGQRQFQDVPISSLSILGASGAPNTIANGLRQAFGIANQQPLGNLATNQLLYSGLPAGSFPINNLPINSLPINNLPFNSWPMNNIPLNNLPINDIPGLPLNNLQINNFPAKSPALNNVRYINDVPLANILSNFLSENRLPRNINNLQNINNVPINNYLPNNNIIPNANNAALANTLANLVTGNILSGMSQITPNRNLANGQSTNGLQISNLANEINLANLQYALPNQSNNLALSSNFKVPNNGCGCNTGVPNKFSVPVVPTNSIAKLPLYNGMPVIKITETVYQVGPCGC